MPERGRKRLRAALYARVSTLAGQDVATQLGELQAAAAARGWEVVGPFSDSGVSGARASRPALDDLLAQVQAGRVDVVLVWKLDRLGRSVTHLVTLVDDLGARGVDLVSLHDPGIDTTTTTGRLLFQILAAFAEYERGVIRERVAAGMKRASAAGKHIGRPRKDVDIAAAAELLAKGWSLVRVARSFKVDRRTLARKMNEAGFSSNGGEGWTSNPATPEGT